MTYFKCQKKRHYANDCKNKKISKKISENFNIFLLIETHKIKELQSMNLSKRILIRKEDFEGEFTLISLHKKLMYLSSNVEVLKFLC